jgi:hypothetical protein
LDLARHQNLAGKHAASLGHLGHLELQKGELDRAISLHHEQLSVARDSGDLPSTGEALHRLSVVHAAAGNMGLAMELDSCHLALALPDATWEISDGAGGVLRARLGAQALAIHPVARLPSAGPASLTFSPRCFSLCLQYQTRKLSRFSAAAEI